MWSGFTAQSAPAAQGMELVLLQTYGCSRPPALCCCRLPTVESHRELKLSGVSIEFVPYKR